MYQNLVDDKSHEMTSMENRTKLVVGIVVLMLAIMAVSISIASAPLEEEETCPTTK
ncbi:MAG: hypothetical protein ACFFB7_01455 [Candidatus Sifarchaeia archaeon]